MKARYESFGGIVWDERPEFTAFVDRAFMRNLGFDGSDLWKMDDGSLSAPIDVHFNITNRCGRGCEYCYNRSNGAGSPEVSTEKAMGILDSIARMQAATVAFGGGEPMEREDLFILAEHARKLGLIPNMSTNGLLLNVDRAQRCAVFGHIHVTLDSGERDGQLDVGSAESLEAISLLKRVGVSFGLNFVVTRKSYPLLEKVCQMAGRCGVPDIMFLRFKPFGRGEIAASELLLTDEQNRSFFPLVKRLARRYRIVPKVDCSFLPMVCCHGPSRKVMEFFGAHGCEGGNYLVEVACDGQFRACTFSPAVVGDATEMPSLWQGAPGLSMFRDWAKTAPEPCRSCKYLSMCKGGCHAIAEKLTGSFGSPDPGCPIVAESRGRTATDAE